MPKVGGELRQELLDVLSAAVRRRQAMDGKRMPQIMDARPLARLWLPQPALIPEIFEQGANLVIAQRQASLVDEVEGRFWMHVLSTLPAVVSCQLALE